MFTIDCSKRSFIFLLNILILAIELVNCDLEQKVNNPEYLKKELKDLIYREIDIDKDGKASFEELKNYTAILHDKNTAFNIDRQWTVYSPQIHEVFSWEGYEPEKKEVLTWDHYFNQTYPELMGIDIGIPITRQQDTSSFSTPEPDKEKKSHGDDQDEKSDEASSDPHLDSLKQMAKRADARWKLADENGDTLLTKQEFKSLIYPDEGPEELQNLYLHEAVEDMDLNKDGKICLDEFMKHLQVLASDAEKREPQWLLSQQENFGRFLDLDKDGVLDDKEIRNWLIPPKEKKFETEVKRLLEIGDINQDTALSMSEFMEHYEYYLTLFPSEFWPNDTQDPGEYEDTTSAMGDLGDDTNNHDEL